MNYPMIARMLGFVLLIGGVLMLLPLAVALIYAEKTAALAFGLTALAAGLVGLGLTRLRPGRTELFACDGFAIVGLAWVVLSAVGAIPFVITGDIPNYIDALFETVSGFTTTGATLLADVEAMSRSCMFWRCLTHWIGGMGILVFAMAVLPMSGEYSMHIMRAEVPGPTVGKLVPRARKTAMLLYLIYVVLTITQILLLLCGGMNLYDAVIHSFSTAGTGGFSNRAASIGAYDSAYLQWVIAVFMLLYAINFNLYYFILIGRVRTALKSEELHWYLLIIFGSTMAICAGICNRFGSFFTALRHAFFQVTSIISTTGFATDNFDLWPEYTRWILLLLLVLGACAGSTGGGIKVSRLIILLKAAAGELRHLAHPREITQVRLEGSTVDRDTVRSTCVFAAVYFLIFLAATLLISLDGYDTTTNFTSVLTCLSNVGPGLNMTGPAGNFGFFSWRSKLILSWCMLAGRLELFPVLLLSFPSVWKRK